MAGLQSTLPPAGPLLSPVYTFTPYGVRGQVPFLRGITRYHPQRNPELILLECEDANGNIIALGLNPRQFRRVTAHVDIGFMVSPELREQSEVYRIFPLPRSELSPSRSVLVENASFHLRPSRTVLQEVSTDVTEPLTNDTPCPIDGAHHGETVQVKPYHWCEALLKAHGVRLHRLVQTPAQTAAHDPGHDLHFFALRASASSSSDGTSPFISLPTSSTILCVVEVDDQRWIFGDDHVDCSVHIRLEDFDPSMESVPLPDSLYKTIIEALDAAPTPPFGETSAKLSHPDDADRRLVVQAWVEGSGGRKAPLIEKRDANDETEKEDVLWVGIDIHWKPLEDKEHLEDTGHEEDQERQEDQEHQPRGDEDAGGNDEGTGGDDEGTGETDEGTGEGHGCGHWMVRLTSEFREPSHYETAL
ncbi:hypothetical protein VTO73DRAFT_10613 [Trametes versicolor]